MERKRKATEAAVVGGRSGVMIGRRIIEMDRLGGREGAREGGRKQREEMTKMWRVW